jgi:hypothetical protein
MSSSSSGISIANRRNPSAKPKNSTTLRRLAVLIDVVAFDVILVAEQSFVDGQVLFGVRVDSAVGRDERDDARELGFRGSGSPRAEVDVLSLPVKQADATDGLFGGFWRR